MKHKNESLNSIKKSFDSIHENLSKLLNNGEISIPHGSLSGDHIPHRSLSGDHIFGGKIIKFSSTGIEDLSSKTSLMVTDKGISTKTISAESINGNITVSGNLQVTGDISAERLHVKELTSDVRITRARPLEFKKEDNLDVYNIGLYWFNEKTTHQFVLRAEPDRLWSSTHIDLNSNKEYMIDGIAVLNAEQLGNSVRRSNLTKVGTLQDLKTIGDLRIDNHIYYESVTNRIGFGTESPNGKISITGENSEIVIDPLPEKTKFGNWTTHDLDIITDDTSRIYITSSGKIIFGKEQPTVININGNVGIGVKNPDADLCVASSLKIANKKHTVADDKPKSGVYTQGDIVWNSSPNPAGYVGWICVRSGTPGDWKPFGAIAR